MCFTPVASIITAVFESLVTFYLFYKIKDRKLYPIAIFVFLLGFYQLSEFMLCSSNNDEFWARIGFATFTFMPILLYHFFINASGNKILKSFYSLPISFSLIALFYPGFINYSSCNTLHVTVESLVFNQSLLLMFMYIVYYFFLPTYAVYVFSKKIKIKKFEFSTKIGVVIAPLAIILAILYYLFSTFSSVNEILVWLYTSVIIISSVLVLILLFILLFKESKRAFLITNSLILLSSSAALIVLNYLIPNFALNYASIFCQFAVLYAIASVFLINSLGGKVPKY